MPEEIVKYEIKTIQTIRGMEARTTAKWEKDGWELVQQSDPALLRATLTFRRPKKPLPKRTLIAGGALIAVAVIGIGIGAVNEGGPVPASTTTPVAAAATPTTAPTSTPSSSTPSTSATTSRPVRKAEVLAGFRHYFKERAAANVMVAKAVTKVTFSHHVVHVVFDPAAAGVSQEAFDEFKGFDNLAKFVATPIAFDDALGNWLRPAVARIETTRPDGSSLGDYTAAQVLQLNELTK